MRILVVEDDPVTRSVVVEAIRGWSHDVVPASDGREAWELFQRDPNFDVVVSDWRMPSLDGLELCRHIREFDKATYTYFILLTVADSRDNRVRALEDGADDFLPKPLDVGELEIRLIVASRVTRLRSEVRAASERVSFLEEQARSRRDFEGMVGKSPTMQEVFRRIRLAGQSDASVFLSGESGTGKELAARAIHAQSARREQPFVAVNCAAIPGEILESELFGHVRGAFTGAVHDKEGLVLSGDGGTLFLDEIGDLNVGLQSKLLRFLEERVVRPVGGEIERSVDVRIVTATHRDLAASIQNEEFREDLYYRVRVFQIDLPSLSERREDLPVLVDHFVTRFAESTHKAITGVAPAAMRRLLAHHWPGNIRELRNAIEHAFVVAEGEVIEAIDLPHDIATAAQVAQVAAPADRPNPTTNVTTPVAPSDAEALIRVVEECDGNRAAAARKLGISRVALWKRIRKLDIDDRLPPTTRGRPR